MSDIKVNFIHPTDGLKITVTLDESMTAQEAVVALIANGFLKPYSAGYNLLIIDKEIHLNESFSEAGVKNDQEIVISKERGTPKQVSGDEYDISNPQIDIMHPTDGRILTVTVNASITAQEIISELISNNFISNNSEGYCLAIQGGKQLQGNESLKEAWVRPGDVIRVIPSTSAGGGYMISSLGDLPIEDRIKFYIYIINGFSWKGSINEVILENFENIAREIGPNASIVKGLNEPFWSNEIIEKYLGKSHQQILSLLPALLITNSHPSNLRENSLRLIIPLRNINRDFFDVSNFFILLVQFIKNGDLEFLNKFDDKTSMIDKILDYVEISPSFFGIGINLKAFIKNYIKS